MRTLRKYFGFSGMAIKEVTAYRVWFWMDMLAQAIAMTVYVYFWRAVYAGTGSIAGLDLQTTLNYILIVRILVGLAEHQFIGLMGEYLREGRIAIELLRPIDFQGLQFANSAAHWYIGMALRLPLLFLALAFGLELPSDPLYYLFFFITFTLGATVLFFFEWIVGCLAFYTTEVWGIMIMLFGVQAFFSGALVPLNMMPGWLRAVAEVLPFQQAVYTPISFLSGIQPLANAPLVWAEQVVWILALWWLSRLIFSRAVRTVTVQGG